MKGRLSILLAAITLLAFVAVTAAFALSSAPRAGAKGVKRAVVAPSVASVMARSAHAPLPVKVAGRNKSKKAQITPEQARAAALAVQPGTVTEVELEHENGIAQYSVAITAKDGSKHDVEVDASTGKVLKVERDDEDEDDHDGDDD